MTAKENLAMICDTILYLKDHGKFVIYDAEHSFDGFSDGPDYAFATWQAAEKAGSDFVVLCDTNGGRLPNEIALITSFGRSNLNSRIRIATLNDFGLGLSNPRADQ